MLAGRGKPLPTQEDGPTRPPGAHAVGGEFGKRTPADGFEPGRWYFQRLPGVDHLDICISPQPSQIGWKRRFYSRLYKRLAALEVAKPVTEDLVGEPAPG